MSAPKTIPLDLDAPMATAPTMPVDGAGVPVEASDGALACVEVQEAQALSVRQDEPDMNSPMGLMVYALQNGQVGALEQLVQLKRGIDADEALKAFNSAFVALHQEMHADRVFLRRVKNGLATNSGQVVAKYAPLEYILATLKPVLLSHGFTVRWEQEPRSLTESLVTCILSHVGGHSERSAFLAKPEGNDKLANGSQRMAGGVTTAKRITLKAVLGVEEQDADKDFENSAPESPLINEVEAAELLRTLQELGGDEERFCDLLGVALLSDLTEAQLPRAKQLLAQKRRLKEAGR